MRKGNPIKAILNAIQRPVHPVAGTFEKFTVDMKEVVADRVTREKAEQSAARQRSRKARITRAKRHTSGFRMANPKHVVAPVPYFHGGRRKR